MPGQAYGAVLSVCCTHRAAGTMKDPENCAVCRYAQDAPLGKVCLAALGRASINIYLFYLFSLALGLCIWREIHEEKNAQCLVVLD